MKKTLAKILAIALCAVLLVTGSVYITLAYLQSQSNVVQNTFTVSDIKITLDEAKVDELGKKLDDSRVTQQGQSYRLIPGTSYVKDPTVHVNSQSEDCFIVIAIYDNIFMNNGTNRGIDVDYNGANSTVYDQIEANGWKPLPNCQIKAKYFDPAAEGEPENLMENWVARTEGAITGHNYKLYYYAGKPGEDAVVEAGEDLVIFEGFKLDSNMDVAGLNNTTFAVVAFGMQTSGYDTEFTEETPVVDQVHTAFISTFGDDTTPKPEPAPEPDPNS